MKQKSIYVTVRVNPHVPGPMETRNKKVAKNEAATTRTNDWRSVTLDQVL